MKYLKWFNIWDYLIYGLLFYAVKTLLDGFGNYYVKNTPQNELSYAFFIGISSIALSLIIAFFSGKFKNIK